MDTNEPKIAERPSSWVVHIGHAMGLFAGWFAGLGHGVEETIPTPKPGPPSIEEYATIEGYCQGAPIYSFSNIDYVYGIGPDL